MHLEYEVCLNSDFEDYYDKAFDKIDTSEKQIVSLMATSNVAKSKSSITYVRRYDLCDIKGEALRKLKMLGTPVIELKQVTQFVNTTSELVVYTNPKEHCGRGKIVTSLSEANIFYQNCLASEFITETNCKYLKYLQIGNRRFSINMKLENMRKLNSFKIESITELSRDYNQVIRLPIFSIDYIPYGNSMLATDFNQVENLRTLGFERFISSEEIVNLIKDAIIKYKTF